MQLQEQFYTWSTKPNLAHIIYSNSCWICTTAHIFYSSCWICICDMHDRYDEEAKDQNGKNGLMKTIMMKMTTHVLCASSTWFHQKSIHQPSLSPSLIRYVMKHQTMAQEELAPLLFRHEAFVEVEMLKVGSMMFGICENIYLFLYQNRTKKTKN